MTQDEQNLCSNLARLELAREALSKVCFPSLGEKDRKLLSAIGAIHVLIQNVKRDIARTVESTLPWHDGYYIMVYEKGSSGKLLRAEPTYKDYELARQEAVRIEQQEAGTHTMLAAGWII